MTSFDCIRKTSTRLGIGLHTNDRLIKRVSIGGYIGYGYRDLENVFQTMGLY